MSTQTAVCNYVSDMESISLIIQFLDFISMKLFKPNINFLQTFNLQNEWINFNETFRYCIEQTTMRESLFPPFCGWKQF